MDRSLFLEKKKVTIVNAQGTNACMNFYFVACQRKQQ